jgi:hypothetical protein
MISGHSKVNLIFTFLGNLYIKLKSELEIFEILALQQELGGEKLLGL